MSPSIRQTLIASFTQAETLGEMQSALMALTDCCQNECHAFGRRVMLFDLSHCPPGGG